MEPQYGTFHDAVTGETVTRELTQEEINENENMSPSYVD